MKISEKELMFLASVGACHQSTFCEDCKDYEKAKRFNKIMKAIIEAQGLTELLETPT